MISKDFSYRILTEALSYSKADKTYIMLSGGKHALTRFANNVIHQNVLQKDYHIKVISSINNKIGVASSNLFSGNELKNVVEQSNLIASNQNKETAYNFLEKQEIVPIVDVYDDATIELSPEDRAEKVCEIIEKAKGNDFTAAGTLFNSDSLVAIMNSNNIFRYHTETEAGLTLTFSDKDKNTGREDFFGNKFSDLEINKTVDNAINKTLLAKNPVKLDYGKYDVFLEESAVSDLLMFFLYLGMSGLYYVENRSFMSNMLNRQITGDKLTLIDDYTHPKTYGLPFDFEGTPRKILPLVEKGIAKNICFDTLTGQKAGKESTGHALPFPNSLNALPINTRMGKGELSKDSMLAKIENGIYVNNFHYNNVVDPLKPIITGLTRDGTYLVENGEIVAAVKNFRYNEALLETFNRVIDVSKEQKLFFHLGKMLVSAITVKDFNFTGIAAE